MSTYLQALESFRALLETAAPTRIVTRNYKHFSLYSLEDRKKGIYTVLAGGIRGWPAGTSERVAEDGHQVIRVLCRQELDETAAGTAIDAAEFAMLDEVLEVVGQELSLPDELHALQPSRMEQSQQLEHPLAWIGIELDNFAITE